MRNDPPEHWIVCSTRASGGVVCRETDDFGDCTAERAGTSFITRPEPRDRVHAHADGATGTVTLGAAQLNCRGSPGRPELAQADNTVDTRISPERPGWAAPERGSPEIFAAAGRDCRDQMRPVTHSSHPESRNCSNRVGGSTARNAFVSVRPVREAAAPADRQQRERSQRNRPGSFSMNAHGLLAHRRAGGRSAVIPRRVHGGHRRRGDAARW